MCLIHKEKKINSFIWLGFKRRYILKWSHSFWNTEYKVHIKKIWKRIKTSRLVYPCKASASLANLTGMTSRIDLFLVIRTVQSPQSSQKKPKSHILLLTQLQPLEGVSKPLPALGSIHHRASTQTVPLKAHSQSKPDSSKKSLDKQLSGC